MFAVVDVETTGGHSSGHKMTEIAIVITDGENILEEYTTLLNPEQHIPLNIQTLTGIKPEMVADAPFFEEKSDEIRAVLGDNIFVAHNVNFDYAFVKSAFAECGVEYNPKRLCSVRYARKVNPGLRSYSLRNLCKHFAVNNEAAHRAWGDARATTEILHMLLAKDASELWKNAVKKNSGEFNLPANVTSSEYHQLPEAPGVYYFLDKTGKPLYIGKARNLKKRVATHFISNKETKRSQAFKREIHHIDFELTGSELLAVLLEDHEIRHHWPRYNLAQKNPKKRFGVFAYLDQKDNWKMGVNRITSQKGYLAEFFSYNEALNWAYKKVIEHRLNPMKCGFPESYLKDSAGEKHNENFSAMLNSLDGSSENYIIKTTGRNKDEEGFAFVENGRFSGIGFIPRDGVIQHIDDIQNYLKKLRSSITTNAVITKVMNGEDYQTIPLSAAS